MRFKYHEFILSHFQVKIKIKNKKFCLNFISFLKKTYSFLMDYIFKIGQPNKSRLEF